MNEDGYYEKPRQQYKSTVYLTWVVIAILVIVLSSIGIWLYLQHAHGANPTNSPGDRTTLPAIQNGGPTPSGAPAPTNLPPCTSSSGICGVQSEGRALAP